MAGNDETLDNRSDSEGPGPVDLQFPYLSLTTPGACLDRYRNKTTKGRHTGAVKPGGETRRPDGRRTIRLL